MVQGGFDTGFTFRLALLRQLGGAGLEQRLEEGVLKRVGL